MVLDSAKGDDNSDDGTVVRCSSEEIINTLASGV